MAQVGKRAIIVGAGIGGLAVTGALSRHFEQVVVLERDHLSGAIAHRVAIPQGRHAHLLLGGGQVALESLFPEFAQRLRDAGAVTMVAGMDMRYEHAGLGPMPRRDLGFSTLSASRPLVEDCLRSAALAHGNVEIRDGAAVLSFVVSTGRQHVTGVRYEREGRVEVMDADLVVDASARGELTLACLDNLGLEPPPTSTVGVGMGYTTGVYEIPPAADGLWKGVLTVPQAPHSTCGMLLIPMEGGRWIASAGGRGDQAPPPDDSELFLVWLGRLHSQTGRDAVGSAQRTGPLQRFAFKASLQTHYERLTEFPTGLLAIGDAVGRINPMYGQGMSIAAQQALGLTRILASVANGSGSLEGIHRPHFARCAEVLAGPWSMAALRDFAYPSTTGNRPPDVHDQLAFADALLQLAYEDEAVHRVLMEVQHLLRPQRAIAETPDLVERVHERMHGLQLTGS